MDIRKVKIKYQNAFLIFLILLNFLTVYLYPQDLTRPSRQGAYEAFSKEDYEKAFREFTVLLQNFPKDPLYKYYCGVCLVKLNREPSTASGYLQDAVSNQLEIRTVPDDAWYYLGRAQQMSGNFNQAIKSYELFEKNAGRKAARDLNVSDLINECHEGKGEVKEPLYREVIEKNATLTDGKAVIADHPADSGAIFKPAGPKAEPKKETLPASYDRSLTEAMDYQVRADSLNSLAAEYRVEYNKLAAGQKQAAMERIRETEALAVRYQKMADERFGRSDTLNTGKNEAAKFSREIKPVAEAQQDTGRKVAGRISEAPDRLVIGQNPVDSTTGIYSLFNIAAEPSILADQKIEIDPRLPAGLIYRIQAGVYSKPLTLGYFKGIVPVSGFRIPGSASVRYFAGLFRQSADAGKALLRVRQKGFRDAFVVAAMDGKPVSLERAALLEKEWGQKPFLTVTVAPAENKGISETPTLVFRVEIVRSLIPVSDEKSETFKSLAGNRGLEILLTPDGNFVYLVGKFITFESAEEYAGLLKRNGYLDAKVVAYLGNREIAVEKAKKLFEEAQ